MADYRPIPDERADEFRAHLSYAFRPQRGPYDPGETEELPPPADVGERRGLFDGEELLAVCRHFWFDARVAGENVPIGGVSAVATPPENRRQGLVRELLRESLTEYRSRHVPLAALWPFETSFYRQFGWATCNKIARHHTSPETLRLAAPEADGQMRPLDPDDWEAMADVLAAHGADYELTIDRTEEWWRKRVFHGWEKDPYVYGWEDDAGTLRGYVVYTIDDDGGERTLETYDVPFTDPAAERHLYRFLADHDSQVETVELYGPAETSLLDRVDDPEAVTTELRLGPMLRLVDVPTAMSARPFPTDVTVDLVLDVTDPLVDWNDGRFRLCVADGRASCERVDGTESVGAPDVELDVGSLSQLFVGYREGERMVAEGDVSVGNETAIDALSRAFPTRDVFLRENF